MVAAPSSDGAEGKSYIILVTGAQCHALEAALASGGICVAQDEGEACGGASTERLTFYDTAASALTSRDWWLLQRDSDWQLRMPAITFDSEQCRARFNGHQDFSDIKEILERVGLVEHAAMYAKGHVKSVEGMLKQTGVVPFAKIACRRTAFRKSRFSDLAEALKKALNCPDLPVGPEASASLSLTRLAFDVSQAENQTVADYIFSHGSAARVALEAALVRIYVSSEEDSGRRADAVSPLPVEQQHFSNLFISPKAACPEAMAFMVVWRPAHLRALRRAGVQLIEAAPGQSP